MGAPPEQDPGARHRLFDAVDAAISGLATQRPLLLVLDDLHWADRPTLLLLAFLMRSRRTGPLLVLGTYRDTELGRHSPLAGALADLQRDGVLDRLAMRGLERAESAELVESWIGREAARPVADEIHERTAGNVFFVEEVLRAFDEDGRAALPEGIRQAVGTRLAHLSEVTDELAAQRAGEFGFAKSGKDWRALINQTWARDWSDPCEDIYTLEDGKPSHSVLEG